MVRTHAPTDWCKFAAPQKHCHRTRRAGVRVSGVALPALLQVAVSFCEGRCSASQRMRIDAVRRRYGVPRNCTGPVKSLGGSARCNAIVDSRFGSAGRSRAGVTGCTEYAEPISKCKGKKPVTRCSSRVRPGPHGAFSLRHAFTILLLCLREFISAGTFLVRYLSNMLYTEVAIVVARSRQSGSCAGPIAPGLRCAALLFSPPLKLTSAPSH